MVNGAKHTVKTPKNSTYRPHKKLDAWQKSIDLTVSIYELTKCLPDDEKFGLISQMRRASVSISCNIAEGAARNSKKEFKQFLYISLGSLSELDTLLVICEELKLLKSKSVEEITNKIVDLSKLISGLINYTKR